MKAGLCLSASWMTGKKVQDKQPTPPWQLLKVRLIGSNHFYSATIKTLVHPQVEGTNPPK